MGLGTVGLGIYRLLAAQPDRFEVVGIAIRDRDKHLDDGVPPGLLSTNAREVARIPCELVVELMGGLQPATEIIATAIDSGRDVVTANKEVIASHGVWLERRAAASGAQLLYSASVGGEVPVLETVRRIHSGSIRAIRGILNGTTNFVLDRMAVGLSFDDAIRAAQERGLAEADPTRDLDGSDAVCKLSILVRVAFGIDLPPVRIRRLGIEDIGPADIRAAQEAGQTIRLVATCLQTSEGIHAEVRPERLPVAHPLAQVRGEDNRVSIEFEGQPPLVLSGRGAGRWPSARSVLADVLDLVHARPTWSAVAV
jgi:homoserine dehydrogenase